MELLTPELLAQLGFSTIFVIFIIMLWKRLENKDHRIEEQEEKKDVLLEQNIKIVEGVKHALEKNTEVMNRVLDRFDETMRRNRGN